MAFDDGRNSRGSLPLLVATLCAALVVGAVLLEGNSHVAPNPPLVPDVYLHTPATDPSVPSADSVSFPARPDSSENESTF